jgi:hypothetical protein
MLTYGDGVADLDIRALLRFHRSHRLLATVTADRPSSRFGGLQLDGDRVGEFEETPQLGAGWVNGGFFVLEPGVADYIDSDEMPFERAPLEDGAAANMHLAQRLHAQPELAGEAFNFSNSALVTVNEIAALSLRGRAARAVERSIGAGPARGRDRHLRERLSQARVRQADHRDGAVLETDRDRGHLSSAA